MARSKKAVPGNAPKFMSTQPEIRKAVAENSVQRGVFLIANLKALKVDAIIDKVAAVQYDNEVWRESANELSISPFALDVLDQADPPIPYPQYFCTPEMLQTDPLLIIYYRNVAMVSRKVMQGTGLSTLQYEVGVQPSYEIAKQLAQYFNAIVSPLITQVNITPRRHLEMVFANIGDSLGGAWRNEVGRLAYVSIVTPLVLFLYDLRNLDSVAYSLKGRISAKDEEEETEDVEQTIKNGRNPSVQVLEMDNFKDRNELQTRLQQLGAERLIYNQLRLTNGYRLQFNRQLTLKHPTDSKIKGKIGPDFLYSDGIDQPRELIWAAELKGGADPAGSDEHWKTATKAFDRILEVAKETDRTPPELSFMATIIVERVAFEIQKQIDKGVLKSAYNLTQIAADPNKHKQFLVDVAKFLGCERIQEPVVPTTLAISDVETGQAVLDAPNGDQLSFELE